MGKMLNQHKITVILLKIDIGKLEKPNSGCEKVGSNSTTS